MSLTDYVQAKLQPDGPDETQPGEADIYMSEEGRLLRDQMNRIEQLLGGGLANAAAAEDPSSVQQESNPIASVESKADEAGTSVAMV